MLNTIKLSQMLEQRTTELYNQILELIQKEQYEETLKLLTSTKDNQANQYNENVAVILQKLLNLINTGDIPKSNYRYKNSHIRQAILNHDFNKALNIHTQKTMNIYREYLKEYNIDPETDIINILLIKLNELRTYIKQELKFKEIFKEQPRDKDIENILIELFNNNIELSTKMIKEYLIQINKEKYTYLVINLIKISLAELDKLFLKPANVLLELSKDEYIYDISFYIQDFYVSLSENKTGIAKIYLNIISKYSPESTSIISLLENDLNNALERVKIQKNQDKQTILKKLQQMKMNDETISIWQSMPRKRRYEIYEILKDIPELVGFGTGEEPKNIALRYIDKSLTKENLYQNIKEAISLYNQKKYQLAINKITQVIRNPYYTPYVGKHYAYMYTLMGHSYLNVGDQDIGIKYLTLATELNMEDPNGTKDFDFTRKINNIKTNMSSSEDELTTPFISSIFENDINNYYGIHQIEAIANYISTEKVSIEESCQIHNLNEEQILLVKLIFAREYYIEGMYLQGDILLQEVEKSNQKTKKIRNILNDIRTNKKFYKNRNGVRSRKRIIN